MPSRERLPRTKSLAEGASVDTGGLSVTAAFPREELYGLTSQLRRRAHRSRPICEDADEWMEFARFCSMR